MSTSFHPQTDGKSECTNKMVTQLLCAAVDHSVEYTMNATTEATSKTPFELVLGFIPWISGGRAVPSNLLAVDDFASDHKAVVSDTRDVLFGSEGASGRTS